MPWAPIVGGIASLAGGLIGNIAGAGDRDKALKMQQAALENIQNVNTPDIEAMKLALQKYNVAGQLDPRMVQTMSQDPSLMAKISTDPRLQQAQMQSLSSLQGLSSAGLRPQDIAAMNQIRQQANQQANSANQAALQQLQARGQSGSGDTLAAQLINNQGAANRAQQGGLDTAGQAAQSALQAISQAGNMASGMQGSSFNQQAQQADAQDVINRFNTQNAQQVAGQNIAQQNAAQAQNLANRQSIMNQNTGVANQQEIANKGLQQQNYNNQLQRAQAVNSATQPAAQALNNNANATSNMWSGMGNAINSGIGAANASANNEKYWETLTNMYGNKPKQQPTIPSQGFGTDGDAWKKWAGQ